MDSFWKNRPTLITGASGFVAAHIAELLLQQGAVVTCLLRNPDRPGALSLLNLDRQVRTVQGAVEDLPLMKALLNNQQIDAVFHLAAQSIVGIAAQSPTATFESNIRGTYNLLEACRGATSVRRVVVASSEKVYGASGTASYHEEQPLAGQSPYDVSKSCADLISRSFAVTCGLPVAVIRSSNIYGPGDLNLSRIVPGTVFSILEGIPPVIRGDGSPAREFIYVADVARSYLLLAEQIELAAGEAFNVSTGSPIRIIDLVSLLLRVAGLESRLLPHILQPSTSPVSDCLSISTDKIYQRLGWKAQVQLEEGLRQTVAWYRQFKVGSVIPLPPS